MTLFFDSFYCLKYSSELAQYKRYLSAFKKLYDIL